MRSIISMVASGNVNSPSVSQWVRDLVHEWEKGWPLEMHLKFWKWHPDLPEEAVLDEMLVVLVDPLHVEVRHQLHHRPLHNTRSHQHDGWMEYIDINGWEFGMAELVVFEICRYMYTTKSFKVRVVKKQLFLIFLYLFANRLMSKKSIYFRIKYDFIKNYEIIN